MNNRRFLLFLLAIVLLIGAGYGGKYLSDLFYYKNAMEELSISHIDVSRVKDGTYTGSYDARLVSAKVAVTVESGKITKIVLLKHKNDRGEAAKSIVGEILKKQSPSVDAVTGATNSSRTIMKAVENALKKGAASL